MKSRLRATALILLGLLSIIPSTARAAVPPLPIACMEEPTCDCICSQGYDGFAAYREYGCVCGNPVSSPTCVECGWSPDYSYEMCVTVNGAAFGSCQWSGGHCYPYSFCDYTGP